MCVSVSFTGRLKWVQFFCQDLNEDLSAVQTRWLSGNRQGGGAGGAGGAPNPMRTPDVENMDMDAYAKNLNAMNDSLHDLQSDIQRLASQQSQIQQMMSGQPQQQPQQQLPQQQQALPPNPMDPQPFYIAPDHPGHHQLHHPSPQRRTWGQPQPIHFAHQPPPPPHMEQPWSPRRQQWGHRPPPQQQPMGYGYGPPSTSPYSGGAGGGSDPYYSHQRGPVFNGAGSPYDPQPSGMYGTSPSYSPGYPSGYGGGGGGYQSGAPFNTGQYMSPQQGGRMGSSPNRATPGAPFRLHEAGSSPSSSSSAFPRTSFSSPSRQEQQPQPPEPMSPTSRTSVPLAESSPLSRQTSRDSVGGGMSGGVPQNTAAPGTGGRMHTSVPAPGEDDMAPQNVSFIDSADEKKSGKKSSLGGGGGDGGDDNRGSSESPPPAATASSTDDDARLRRLPERLSQLNISSGSKTYRVHHSSDKESSPSPAAVPSAAGGGSGGGARPTISSTFKQSRRSSGGGSPGPSGSGPSSLRSNPGRTEEEDETLANMKTERLKDDKDASTGFVISFDDEQPKRSKPALKPR